MNIRRLKAQKGITLIALVVTIIVLIILAGISISLLFGKSGIITRAKKGQEIADVATAQEKLELIKSEIPMKILDGKDSTVNLKNYLEELNKEKNKKNCDVTNIEKLNDTNAEIMISGKYKFLAKDEENGNVKIIYLGEAGGLQILPTEATYTYPTPGIFEVINNESQGKLTVKSSNEEIAKASISGTTVTVTPQKMAGTAQIIVISEANGNYAEGRVTHTAKVENGTILLEAEPYIAEYDGKAHDALISVTVDPKDCKLEYSLDGGEFTETMPKVTMASEKYSISIKASKEGYTTNILTKTIVVEELTTKSLKEGDYIKYNTGVKSVGENGIITCVVLYDKTSEYGIQIISNKKVAYVTLGGSDWATARNSYNNAITTLNTEAEKYLNKEYATDARCVGSVPTNQNGKFINKNSENVGPVILKFTSSVEGVNNMKDEDTNYKTDKAQLEKLKIWTTGEYYWLASRGLSGVDSGTSSCLFNVRYKIGDQKNDNLNTLCGVGLNNTSFKGSTAYGIRPCFSLKTDIKITGGNGTNKTPYTM